MVDEQLSSILTQIQNLVVHYAPAAYQLVLANQRFQGLQYLLIAAVFIAQAFAFRPLKNMSEGWEADSARQFIIGFVSGVLLIIGACMFLNIWNWIDVIYPQLGLAHVLIGKVINQ